MKDKNPTTVEDIRILRGSLRRAVYIRGSAGMGAVEWRRHFFMPMNKLQGEARGCDLVVHIFPKGIISGEGANATLSFISPQVHIDHLFTDVLTDNPGDTYDTAEYVLRSINEPFRNDIHLYATGYFLSHILVNLYVHMQPTTTWYQRYHEIKGTLPQLAEPLVPKPIKRRRILVEKKT